MKATNETKEFLLDLVNNGKYNQLEDSVMENIFKVGAYHGLWGEENYGDYDRQNTVYGLLETLQGIFKK